MQVSQFNEWYGWEVVPKSILAFEHLTGWPDPNNWSYSYFIPYYNVINSFREKILLVADYKLQDGVDWFLYLNLFIL
jgi:hypothetical protein